MTIDTSRAPRGEIAARQLVEQLTREDEHVERHYLEIKSEVDLTSTLGAAKIAKFILGSANRPVEAAARAFEGCGVLVVGVQPGGTPSVPSIEVGEFEKRIRPYLGAAGPKWDVARVRVSRDRDVFVFVVEPPPEGQDAFLCWTDFSPSGDDKKHALRNGDIYMRDDQASRKATAAEVLALRERGRSRALPVDLQVELLGRAVREMKDDGRLRDVVEQDRKRLYAALPTSDPEIKHASGASGANYIGSPEVIRAITALSRSASLFYSEPESRSRDAYVEEVKRWAEEAEAAIPEYLDQFLGALVPPVAIRITNRTTTFLEGVVVKVHLEGTVDGIEPRDEFPDISAWPPRSPRQWGPVNRSPIDALNIAGPASNFYMPRSNSSRVTWENGGSVDVMFDVGDLPPKGVEAADPEDCLVLVVRDPAMPIVRGTWSVTAKAHHQVFSGELEVPVANAPAFSTLGETLRGP